MQAIQRKTGRTCAGEVLLDGHDLKTLNVKWLPSQIGLVNQEPALFAKTIRENLLYGKEEVTMDEVIAATFSHSFVTRFPRAL